MFNSVRTYITANAILVCIGTYFFFSTALNALTGIDLCIPCIWKNLFGFHCLGCGLTKAFISILELDFKKAFESNWLIFIIMPFGFFYFIQDYCKHKRKYYA
jgi:hypothetical protein